jgi:hypothetical protein
MSNDENNRSFWTTLPGILTGLAAILTAVGGLITIIDELRPDPVPEVIIPEPSKDEPLKINSFGLDYTTILKGDSSNLSWAVSGAKKVSIFPGHLQVDHEGFLLVSPETSTEYSLTAMNGTEQIAASVRLKVMDADCYAKGNITIEVNGLAQGRGIDLDYNADDPKYDISDKGLDLSYGGYFTAPFTADIGMSPFYGATIVSSVSDYPFWPRRGGKWIEPNASIDINSLTGKEYIWVNTNQIGWSKVSIHKTLDEWNGTIKLSYITWRRFSLGG